MSETRFVHIGDGKNWSFFNGAWQDAPEHGLIVPEEMRRQDGPAIQGHHYAFRQEPAYTDLHARFQIRLASHGDAGLIFRAADAGHFCLLHFPDCGQASRSQHFWAALSRLEDSGHLRLLKLEMVRRVSSTNRDWLDVEAHIVGDRLTARIGETGLFEATDSRLQGGGRIGVYCFGDAEVRRLAVDGRERPVPPFNEALQPPQTWFHPSPETTYGRWQRPGELVRTPRGDLLLNYQVQERAYQGKITPLMIRSSDQGRTWSEPYSVPAMGMSEEGNQWFWGKVHVFPDGQLRMLGPTEDGYAMRETADDGRCWSEARPVQVGPPPPGLTKGLHLGPQAFANLADGSVVMFGYGSHESTLPEVPIHTWGSHHCQAFACRSTDNGRTWSDWTNVDGTWDSQNHPVPGNLDLTEVCAAQVGDGHILALIRPIASPWMWETWSHDGGATWTPCLRGPFPGYATPNMLRTQSGRILVAHRLPGCTIHTSPDDGRSWDQGTLIDSAIWVMGSMLEVEPDRVLYVYWDSFESLMRAQFIRVTPDGLVPVPREEAP